MLISLVVAVAENGVIGCQGDLPWRLSGDLGRFKRLTTGHALLMGRKTYESIGRPLPGRVSIVLSRDPSFQVPDERVLVAASLQEAIALVPTAAAVAAQSKLTLSQDELFVVGGAEIYRQAIPLANRLYRTLVHATPEGDAHLPEIDLTDWQRSESVDYPSDERNEYAATWEKWERTL